MNYESKSYSADSNIELLSIEDFLELTNYLRDVRDEDILGVNLPSTFQKCFKFTSRYLVRVEFGRENIFVAMTAKINGLSAMQVAKRDGVTEYRCFEKEIARLKSLLETEPSNSIEETLRKTIKARSLIPEYTPITETPERKSFEDCLIETGIVTDDERFKNKYLVLDIQTNGPRALKDDILSLSILDPTTGLCYNRFLPLEMQPIVLTSYVNGIAETDLEKCQHLRQQEVDRIIEFFDMKNKTILTISSEKSIIDERFLRNYFKRHHLKGVDDLRFENIIKSIPRSLCIRESRFTRDVAIRTLGLEKKQELHSSLDNCRWEWELFARLKECFLFLDNDFSICSCDDDYLFDASKYNDIPGDYHDFFNIEREDEIKTVEKRCCFTTITSNKFYKVYNEIGYSVGRLFKKAFRENSNIEVLDNAAFLETNNNHKKRLGWRSPEYADFMASISRQRIAKDEELNREVGPLLSETIQAITDTLEELVFHEKKIYENELVIQKDRKCFSICDFSNEDAVLEVLLSRDGNGSEGVFVPKNLFYHCKGRKLYGITFDTFPDEGFDGENNTNIVLLIRLFEIEFFKQ